jgi:D-alanyl-D-alanine carboxypeptidase
MKKFIVCNIRYAGFLWLVLFLKFSVAQAQGFSPGTQLRLQQVLQDFQNDPAFVGGISAAVVVDGLASWEGATGHAARNVDAQNNLLPGGTAFTTSTLSRIYSVTKTFTAALTLELSKQGAFSLDDPVSMYLPLNLINPGLNSSVTIRQLLVHESGYSDYTSEFQFLVATAFQPTHLWTPFEVLYFVHQVSQPGAERHYSSTNYITLGAIIEAVTGKMIEQHFRERFFNPLGLNSMYLDVRESQPSGTLLASPHDNISAFNPVFQLTGQPTFPDAYTNISRLPFDGIMSSAFTSGGIVSDASDVAEWGNALFNGRATSRATLDSMLNSISTTPDAQGDYLGYGIWKSTKMSSTEIFLGHDGSAPGYRAVMFYQPDKNLTLAVLTNFYGADIYAIARALYAALPEFICGNENKKDNKIKLCKDGNTICVDRHAANEFIKNGAYLATCETLTARNFNSKAIIETNENLTAYPNPFSDKITLSFKAMAAGQTTINLFDMNGRLVAHLFKQEMKTGEVQQINFKKQDLPAGTYIVTLETQLGITRQKIVLVH